MDFNLERGQAFSESFDFKGATGKPVAAPTSGVVLILEHGDFIRRYEVGSGLNRLRTNIVWKMDEEETEALPYNTLYYTLYIKDQEFLRGVVRVQ